MDRFNSYACRLFTTCLSTRPKSSRNFVSYKPDGDVDEAQCGEARQLPLVRGPIPGAVNTGHGHVVHAMEMEIDPDDGPANDDVAEVQVSRIVAVFLADPETERRETRQQLLPAARAPRLSRRASRRGWQAAAQHSRERERETTATAASPEPSSSSSSNGAFITSMPMLQLHDYTLYIPTHYIPYYSSMAAATPSTMSRTRARLSRSMTINLRARAKSSIAELIRVRQRSVLG
ncbi:unnamed protein product [Trichogramma brassicae]|uniref:Uncharacterized protein n=1 Tax=Trichogramma brassicae TaxID=86971 RepID=A0A6H5HXV3_9HYME|nr:unnamed protein product [Trichogramma brassicae]